MKGGIDLTQENQSYLRFSLEESVWFQKGQEVEELYSISLDPNVTLTEDDHYVYIRGTLDLSGEYKNDEEEEGDEDFTHAFLPKSVQSVERHPDGMIEFVHRFPVDITIPSSRIASLEDIEVSIQTFDYDILERNCLKLQADLFISGIYGETYEEPLENENDQVWDDESMVVVDEREEVAEEEDEAVEIPIDEVLSQLEELTENAESVDLNVEQLDEAIGEREEEIEIQGMDEDEQDSFETVFSEDKDEFYVEHTAARPPIPDFQPIFRKSEEKEGKLFEPFTVEAKRAPDLEKETEPLYTSSPQELAPFDLSVQQYQEQTIKREAEPVFLEKTEEIEQEQEEVNVLHFVKKSVAPVNNREQKQEVKQEGQSETKSKTSEALSIADFFGRKQEEEQVRVKVCIVQHGETVEDLAERYSVSVQTLLQSNELQPNQDIYEGQVLYVPKSHSYKN